MTLSSAFLCRYSSSLEANITKTSSRRTHSTRQSESSVSKNPFDSDYDESKNPFNDEDDFDDKNPFRDDCDNLNPFE